MYKNKHFFCLPPEWQEQMAHEIGGKFIDDKIIMIPEALGHGYSFFIQVIPGISVLLMDFVLSVPLSIKRVKDDCERFIFHFDLSDQVSQIKVCDIDYRVGYSIGLGLAILSNKVESSFEPSVGNRTFALRLFVDKKLMNDLIKNNLAQEFEVQKMNISKKTLLYHDSIDSNSILLLLSIKEKSIFDEPFDSFLRGISLKLLGNFLNRYSSPVIVKDEMTEIENEGILKAKNYLDNNLYNQFPSIPFLSKMAGMSSTKFKLLFKKRFLDSPKNIFIREKMILANTLLQSGDFSTLTEIIHELDYVKLDYFSLKYFNIFKKKPFENFIKKRNT